MCGLVAVVGPRADDFDIDPALEAIAHRGPDSHGTRTIDLGWTKVQLGACRLAVVDDKPGPWPPHFLRLKVALAWNGELYNTRELRRELGGPWDGRSDTETLAAAVRAWGSDAPRHLNGMFAYVAVDERDRKIQVARDRAGEKPLYLASLDDEHVAFASEIKALLALGVPTVEDWCEDAEALEFDCLEATGLRGLMCFPPGHRSTMRAP